MTALDDRPLVERWPDLADAPHAPVRAAAARRIVRRAATRVDAAVVLPDGTVLGDRRLDRPTLRIHTPRFFHRVGADLRIGLGESYMAGDWDPAEGTDLADLLTAFAARVDDLVPPALVRLRRLVEPSRPETDRNTRAGARANISRHYDLSNEMFAGFLDETMTYSAAWFDGAADSSTFGDLASAQRRKIDRLLDAAHVGGGTRLLEIGTGWGQLALQAAHRGARVHSITLSREQRDLAHERLTAAGVADRVDVEVRDYRDLEQTYDAVVSVEMIEAVGEQFLPDYFGAVAAALVPGGRFALQAITMPHRRVLATRHSYSWVHKYIFPGGFVPSVEQIEQHAHGAGLAPFGERLSLRTDYARTLRLWRERFTGGADRLETLGFDHVFRRMWELYLAYSEAGFRTGVLDDWQLTFRRTH